MRLSDWIVALILFSAVSVVLISAIIDVTSGYGIGLNTLVGNETGPGSVNATIAALTIDNELNKEVLNITTYAPGQPNAQMQSGANAGIGLQQSGLTTALRYALLLYTVPQALLFNLGAFIGLPPVLSFAFSVIMIVMVIIFIAGLPFFREM